MTGLQLDGGRVGVPRLAVTGSSIGATIRGPRTHVASFPSIRLIQNSRLQSPVTTKPKAFVIMPFAREFTAVYEQLILPGLEAAGFTVVRADSGFDQQNIMKDVVRGIAEASLIVA